MDILSALQLNMGCGISLESVEENVQRLYAPFFHEDGDMYSIYIEENEQGYLIRDYGNTLMRVAYTFDINSERKNKVLDKIIKSNNGEIDDGELLIQSDKNNLTKDIYRFGQMVSKVSSIKMLSRENVKTMFFDYLNEYVQNNFAKYGVEYNIAPTQDKSLVVDFVVPIPKRPLYLFAVNDDTRASKTVISCLTFQKKSIPFRSLVVHENFNALGAFYRNQITNAADKQFPTLDDFQTDGANYIERELGA